MRHPLPTNPVLQATIDGASYSRSSDDDVDSLFGGSDNEAIRSPARLPEDAAARRNLPPGLRVPGLHFDPDVQIPASLALDLLRNIKEQDYFKGGTVNQLMLFERSDRVAPETEAELAQSQFRAQTSGPSIGPGGSGLPSFLKDLLEELSKILQDRVPLSTHQLVFPPSSTAPARQAILNLYRPGEGITPHVDLLKRFGDGIIIVSLGSGTVMQLAELAEPKRSVDLWLEPRSILVLEGEARYGWTHGIPARDGDWVEDELGKMWVDRDVRVSITLRFLLPGAEVVGGTDHV